MSSLFVTPKVRPTAPVNIPSEVTNADVEIFKSISPARLAEIQKVSQVRIANDADLEKAQAELLSQVGSLPNFVPEQGSAIDRFMDSQIGLSDEVFLTPPEGEDALTYLNEKFELGIEVENACIKFGIGTAPINLGWNDFKDALNLKQYLDTFNNLAEKVIAFADKQIFDLLGDCPEYLLKTAASKIGQLVKSASGSGNIAAVDKIASIAGYDKVPDLVGKLKKLSSVMPQSPGNITIFDGILTGAGINKAELINKVPFGMPLITATRAKDVKAQTESGFDLLSSVISKDQLKIAKRVSELVIKNNEKPAYSREDSLLRQFERDQVKITLPPKSPLLISDEWSNNIGKPPEEKIIDSSTSRLVFYESDGRPVVKYSDNLTGKLYPNLLALDEARQNLEYQVR